MSDNIQSDSEILAGTFSDLVAPCSGRGGGGVYHAHKRQLPRGPCFRQARQPLVHGTTRQQDRQAGSLPSKTCYVRRHHRVRLAASQQQTSVHPHCQEWHDMVHSVMGGDGDDDKQKKKNTIKKELGITFEMKDDMLENH